MGGTLTRKVVCAYCANVIREGVPPVSHGCCFDCFTARLWDDEGEHMLTEDEIGKEQYEKAKVDRARFRGVPGEALRQARERGAECARLLAAVKAEAGQEPQSATAVRARVDAVTFAMQAFRGWRAYRIMKG